MKTKFLNLALLFLSLTFFTACSGDQNQSAEKTNTGVNQDQATVYACPMHPEVTSLQPGKCPKCKMNLEIAENAANQVHDDHNH